MSGSRKPVFLVTGNDLVRSEAGAVAAVEHARVVTGDASSGMGAWDVLTPSLDALGGRVVTP